MKDGSQSPYSFKASPYSSHSALLGFLPPRGDGLAVVDVGGGEGYLSAELAKRGYQVTCIAKPGSVSPVPSPGVTAIEADLDFVLPDLDSGFDYALLGDVLEHLREPARTLRWAGTLLKPQGRVVASLPNGAHLYVRLHVLLGHFPQHDRGLFDRTHLHFHSRRGWLALFREVGAEIVECRETPVPFSLVLPTWAPAGLALGLERAYLALARLWRTLLAYQFVVLARPIDRVSDRR